MNKLSKFRPIIMMGALAIILSILGYFGRGPQWSFEAWCGVALLYFAICAVVGTWVVAVTP